MIGGSPGVNPVDGRSQPHPSPLQPMKHYIPHDLTMELCKKATVAAFAAYAERFAEYRPTAKWTTETHADISFTVKGFTLNGSFDLEASRIGLELEVPFLLRPFRSKALEVIENEIKTWIQKARNGELD
jgi:hypothetical protein